MLHTNQLLDWWAAWVIVPCVVLSTISLLAVVIYKHEKERGKR